MSSDLSATSAGAVGAHWIRASLQVNPFGYQGKNQPSTQFSHEAEYNKALLDECDALGVSLIAITDHWCVDTAAGLIADADERGIAALPGFEANSSEGVHLLVIFEVGTDLSTVNGAIGACGVAPGCANGTTGNAFTDILHKMAELGALVIPAHVNVANGGMLTGRTGQPLVEMVKDPHLHAIAVIPNQADGIDQESIVKNRKPYKRKHPLAVIHAGDIMQPAQLKEEGATSWFKVSSSRLESLKLAVRTPETRVSLSDPSRAPRTLIREISWTGGFLDGVTVPISGDLTALIGGRGTGKSTVIESLRYVLDLEPLGDDAAKDHAAIVSKVLGPGAIVRVAVDTVSPTPRSFTIERTVANPAVVRDSAGTVTNQQPVDIAGLVEVYGQHELAELASNSARVKEMIQRFAGSTGVGPGHQEVLSQLKTNREKLGNTEEAVAKLQEELAGIPRLQEQVDQFKETDVETRLADLKRLQQDETVFTGARQRVDVVAGLVADLAADDVEANLIADYDGLDDSPQKDKLQAAASATTNLAAAIKSLVVAMQNAIATAESEISTAKTNWETAVNAQREGHDEVLRKLHDDGLEPDKYLQTSNALDGLIAKKPQLAKLNDRLKDLQVERTKLLGELTNHESEQLKALHAAVHQANTSTNGVVVVKPIAAPDRDHILQVIGNHISGPRPQVSAAVNDTSFSTRSFVAAVRGGNDELAKGGIKGAQATNLINAGEPLLRELEELTVGHAVEVLLKVEAGGSQALKRMDELSKGQRATALLLLLLGASTAPLVIDQPEDDLDNRFIYEGVVKHLRHLKGMRQVIASTHNANVPVLGDAELIVALEGDGQHGKPTADGIGSLDESTIRSLAENILEGGPAAFNARQHLYGF